MKAPSKLKRSNPSNIDRNNRMRSKAAFSSVSSSTSLDATKFLYQGLFILFLLLVIGAFFALKSVLSKILNKWTKFLEVLDLQERNIETESYESQKTNVLSSNESQIEFQQLSNDQFDDAFTRVLSSFQNANSNQIFLRRDDVSVLLNKLVEVGACTSSQTLNRRMTFMEIDVEGIKNRSKSFNDYLLRGRSTKNESVDSEPDESVESLSTGELDEELNSTVATLMPRERISYLKMMGSKDGISSGSRDSRSKSAVQLRFADAMVTYQQPDFLNNDQKN